MAEDIEEGGEAYRDPITPRQVTPMKADGRRVTKGVRANGGKRPVVRALRDAPELGVERGAGYVLVEGQGLPRVGDITLSRGDAMDRGSHFQAPAGLFSADWRQSTIDAEEQGGQLPEH